MTTKRPKQGGRKKGTPNRKTRELQEAVAKSGITPLDYMLKVMRDPNAEPQRRDDMAKAAAPYLHPKLSSVELAGKDGKPLVVKIVQYSGAGS